MRIYGMPQCRDRAYGVAAVLTYWVFKGRDRQRSPAMGIKTWTHLENAIQNSAYSASDLQTYLNNLCQPGMLYSRLMPDVLTAIIQPQQRLLRINADGSEIQELESDQTLIFYGWDDLLAGIAPDGFTEWDVLELCRSKAAIIQLLCRLRFEEDRALKQDTPIESLDVEATVV